MNDFLQHTLFFLCDNTIILTNDYSCNYSYPRNRKVNDFPFSCIYRIIVIVLASYITGLSFWYCLLAYIAILFLIEFAKNMIVVILGIAIVIAVTLAMFFGLIAL